MVTFFRKWKKNSHEEANNDHGVTEDISTSTEAANITDKDHNFVEPQVNTKCEVFLCLNELDTLLTVLNKI